MPSSIKISLLALASSVAAVPHYGGHSRFHSLRPSGAHGTGGPYPTGGWGGRYNQTRVGRPTGTGSYDQDTTIEVTSTTTTTLLTTVVVRPSPSPVAGEQVSKESYPTGESDQCGPLTVTVTAQEVVTVTVAPGGGSSAAPAPSPVNPEGGYSAAPVPSPQPAPPAPTPEPAPSSPPAPVEASSKPAAPQPPVQPSPSAPAPPAQSYPTVPEVSSAPAPSPPAPTPSSSGGGYSGAKRGLAYNAANLCKDFAGSFGFAYNWGQAESNDIGTMFVPMLHGNQIPTSQEWLGNVDKAVGKGSKVVMGYNEPDHPDQANMTPEAACAGWKEYMNPIGSKYSDVTILSPSVTNGPASSGMGLDWLSRFYKACPDATVHASNIHFYDVYDSDTINRFKKQVEQAASDFGKPVWVTEFGLNPGSASQDQAASFLKDAMAYMDGSDKVHGYAWFMVGTGENQLNTASGLSTVGKVYAGQA